MNHSQKVFLTVLNQKIVCVVGKELVALNAVWYGLYHYKIESNMFVSNTIVVKIVKLILFYLMVKKLFIKKYSSKIVFYSPDTLGLISYES